MSFKSGIATGSIERDQFFLMLQFGENLEGGGGTELGILERIRLATGPRSISTALWLDFIGHLKTLWKSRESIFEAPFTGIASFFVTDSRVSSGRR